ncbi:ATP-binding cassette domain-containing protein [Geodermatophilus sp. DF01_2]|uniref:ABC transporter ATP-binding protein n=1 Tax=Geodermatophilus sp. DF01-2 TaxID=2559610 RepID=UPI00143019D5|nr:ATP-binding cassette domain-containing protein [Geodermatophilus sp. DF01_2]
MSLSLAGNQILSDATAAVSRGDYVTVTGRSGSGKSTLLNLIAGNLRPDRGVVEINGRDLARRRDRLLAQRGDIGYVYQTSQLVAWMSALDNVLLGMRYQDVSSSSRLKRAEQALTHVGLARRAHHRPHELSGGERQRVSLARAVARRPSLLLADEPTGNLDGATGAEIISVIELMRLDAAIILVTHDSALAARGSRRWIVDSSRLHEVSDVQ